MRNFTDVDDKIIARAVAVGEDPLALAHRFVHEFHADMVGAGGYNFNCAVVSLAERQFSVEPGVPRRHGGKHRGRVQLFAARLVWLGWQHARCGLCCPCRAAQKRSSCCCCTCIKRRCCR